MSKARPVSIAPQGGSCRYVRGDTPNRARLMAAVSGDRPANSRVPFPRPGTSPEARSAMRRESSSTWCRGGGAVRAAR